jgi:hypothetical protein
MLLSRLYFYVKHTSSCYDVTMRALARCVTDLGLLFSHGVYSRVTSDNILTGNSRPITYAPVVTVIRPSMEMQEILSRFVKMHVANFRILQRSSGYVHLKSGEMGLYKFPLCIPGALVRRRPRKDILVYLEENAYASPKRC